MITVLALMFERMRGDDHPSAPRPRNDPAMSHLAAGRTAEAIRLYERRLADCERLLGADHPDTKAARESVAALTAKLNGHRRK